MTSSPTLSPTSAFESVSAARDAAAEANHRIANNLAMVAGLVRIQARGIAAESGAMSRAEVGALLEEIGHRIDTVGHLHRLLSGLVSGSDVDLSDYLRKISQAVVESLSFAGRATLLHDGDETCPVSAERALPLGLIVGELVTNAVKYAHPSGVAGIVTVGCWRKGDKIVVSIGDDGVGLPEGFNPAHADSLGLRLARSLAAQIGATLAFQSVGIGLTIDLTLPA